MTPKSQSYPPSKLALRDALYQRALRRSRNGLFAFAKFTSPSHYRWSWHHELLYRKLEAFAKGEIKRLIIEAPPGHGKSEATSRKLPAFLFGRFPSCRVIACSYTADLAEEMSRDVQNLLETPDYQRVFPGAGIARSKTSRLRADLFDVAGGGIYKCAGVGGGIGGRRFDRGIIDDPVKDRVQANSESHRESTWRWFTSVFHKRQAKGAGILITSTRWHDDDLVGRIKRKIATGESEPYEIITLPALATDKLHAEDPRKPGEALWPWFRSADELEKMKLLEPRDFYALEQQDPRAEGGVEWDNSCFPDSIWFDDWPNPLTVLVVSLDPSKGRDAKHGDYSALVGLGRTADGTLWVEADLARRPTPRIVEDGFEFVRRLEEETHRPVDGFGCESDQFQELLADQFVSASKAKGFMLNLFKQTTGGVSKGVRIRRLSADVTRKNIRFRNTPGTRLLVRQMQEFPVGDHDDGPDALEYARRLAVYLHNGKAKR